MRIIARTNRYSGNMRCITEGKMYPVLPEHRTTTLSIIDDLGDVTSLNQYGGIEGIVFTVLDCDSSVSSPPIRSVTGGVIVSNLKVKYATIKSDDERRVSFSREELLYMINQLDSKDPEDVKLIMLFENLMEVVENL